MPEKSLSQNSRQELTPIGSKEDDNHDMNHVIHLVDQHERQTKYPEE
jgi:hypothetical protein